MWESSQSARGEQFSGCSDPQSLQLVTSGGRKRARMALRPSSTLSGAPTSQDQPTAPDEPSRPSCWFPVPLSKVQKAQMLLAAVQSSVLTFMFMSQREPRPAGLVKVTAEDPPPTATLGGGFDFCPKHSDVCCLRPLHPDLPP